LGSGRADRHALAVADEDRVQAVNVRATRLLSRAAGDDLVASHKPLDHHARFGDGDDRPDMRPALHHL
jgi:hypothetical protein